MAKELGGLEPGRIIAEHRERYIIISSRGESEAEITGNMRFTARSRLDLPVVGDWVGLVLYDAGPALIHKILPRTSVLTRQSAGQKSELQPIAANIDTAFLVQAADRDFSLNRLERYLTLCNTAGVKAVVVLTKTDLAGEARVQEFGARVNERIPGVPVVAISNASREGYEKILPFLEKGKTCCMLGSSGVGKSSLMNNLSGRDLMKTGSLSTSTNKGRHVTSHRELIVLENGALLIDNPGMREVGITDEAGGLEQTFDRIGAFGKHCKYQDCTHTSEAGCAVTEAVRKGEIDPGAYENYLRMEKERRFLEASLEERRRKEREFGRMMKNYKKGRGE